MRRDVVGGLFDCLFGDRGTQRDADTIWVIQRQVGDAVEQAHCRVEDWDLGENPYRGANVVGESFSDGGGEKLFEVTQERIHCEDEDCARAGASLNYPRFDVVEDCDASTKIRVACVQEKFRETEDLENDEDEGVTEGKAA